MKKMIILTVLILIMGFWKITTAEPVKSQVIRLANVVKKTDIIPSEEAKEILARLIESEASGEDEAGKLAVASVVVNRAKMHKKTLCTVIFEQYQFYGTYTPRFRSEPSPLSRRCAVQVLNGKTTLAPEFIYFINTRTAEDSKMIRMSQINEAVRVGKHVFFTGKKKVS